MGAGMGSTVGVDGDIRGVDAGMGSGGVGVSVDIGGVGVSVDSVGVGVGVTGMGGECVGAGPACKCKYSSV